MSKDYGGEGMTELGKHLREARLKKGLELDDIQNATKIQKRYLEAIEEGNLDVLPGHFYARAFIKSYAEAVGLDPEIVLEHINETPLAKPPVEEPTVPSRRAKRERSPIQTSKWFLKTLLGLFAGLIVLVIVIAVSQLNTAERNEEATESPREETNGVSEAPDMESPAEPIEEPAVEEQLSPALSYVAQEGGAHQYELTGAEQIEIAISTTDRCWIELRKDGRSGESIFASELSPGSSERWTLSDASSAWLRLGRPHNVTIEVNGEALDTSMMSARSPENVSIVLKR